MTHTTLTLVRGEPSFDSLSKLETQIHENAANVPCPSLANGDTGHLGLTMSDADFARVYPHHMYTRQVFPGILSHQQTVPAHRLQQHNPSMTKHLVYLMNAQWWRKS